MDGSTPTRTASAGRVSALRQKLKEEGLEGFLIPRADEHQGEYVPARAERLAWLTGFTGSAGMAAVLRNKAAVFVDGRYTIQVAQQVDANAFLLLHLIEQPPARWLADELSGGEVGFDPWLHTRQQVRALEKALKPAGIALKAVAENLIDAIWEDQPAPPAHPAYPHPLDYAGKASAEKRAELGAELAKKRADAAVLTLPDSICWLLNVRGSDVPRVPLCLSFAILGKDGRVQWFLDPAKLTPETLDWLGDEVETHTPDAFEAQLRALAGRKVAVDPASAPEQVFRLLEEAGTVVVEGPDPCQLPKACKNVVEIAGTKTAHKRDGAAVSRFLRWVAEDVTARAGGNDPVTEMEAVDKLYGFRSPDPLLRDVSFETISGAGPNGAICHYRVTEESSLPIRDGQLYLCDSGGQYLDGTTDITRTMAIGAPSQEMKERFTRVLKGHIALATTRFPKGTKGNDLDVLARHALWQVGLDYDHGTGHGVGSFLSVHEGPQRISKAANNTPLQPGMILSNEPGYYKEGQYGIRIENLITVVESPGGPEEERPMLAFETITLAPIDLNLVEPALLTDAEIDWLNAYHARVREEIGPRLEDPAERGWLEEATRPVSRR